MRASEPRNCSSTPAGRAEDPRTLVGVRVEDDRRKMEGGQPLHDRAGLTHPTVDERCEDEICQELLADLRRDGACGVGSRVGHGARSVATDTVDRGIRPHRETSPAAAATVTGVHPIEHLRYVARAQGADPTSLVEDTASMCGSLRFDPSGLVVACRRIVERHPFTGPLWWLCRNFSTSAEPFEAVWELTDEIRSDPTGANLAAVIPDEATVVTIGDPDVIGAGLIRRGDIRVVALNAGHTATSFVRRMERYDVDVEPVDSGVAGVVAHHADVVLIEALAVDSGSCGRAGRVVDHRCGPRSAWGTPVWWWPVSADAYRRGSSTRWWPRWCR